MTNRKAPKQAMQALSAKTDAMRANAVDLLKQLEDQVEKLNQMAEENLEQGMLGHYAEAIKMRDSAKETLQGLRQKLGLGVTGSPGETQRPAEPENPKVDDKMPKMPKPKEGDPNPKENPMNPKEIVVKEVKAVKAALPAEPCYRWILEGAGLEIEDPCDADEVPEVELADAAVRCSWPSSGWLLRLPVAFPMDLESCKVIRRRRRRLLELHLAAAAALDALLCPLLEAVPRQGFGWMDGFLAGPEADAVRARVLELWTNGDLNEGEVEGGNKQHLRSDRYLFMEEDDPAVAPFTRRLDQLVLSIAKEVDELKDLWLMRGRPMAAVYAGAGARYTPHYDCVAGDNGRKVTCVLYLNPFWKPGDGAELQLFPEAKGISPEGQCHEVEPLHGRLACFLCDSRNLHAVKPVAETAKLPRVAISCWYYDTEGGKFHREDERDALRTRG